MNIYTIVATDRVETASQAVGAAFGENSFPLREGVWLVAGSGTAQEICARIGLPVTPGAAAPFSAVVTLAAGYYGFAPSNLWEWIQAKLSTTTASQPLAQADVRPHV